MENRIEQKQTIFCHECGKAIEEGAPITYRADGAPFCEDCAESLLFWCEHCETWHDADECNEVHTRSGDELWCDDCADDAYRCADCHEIFASRTLLYDVRNGFPVCCGCLEDNYYYCEECGWYVSEDDWNFDEDICDQCASEAQNDDDDEGSPLICRYHGADASRPLFWANGEDSEKPFKGFGLELEVDRDERNNRYERECVQELHNLLGERAVFERDGSLHYGFEIVTRPHTFKAFAQDFPLAKVLEICKRYGYKSHDTKTCGLHVHISRRFFGREDAEQERAVGKLIAFYDANYTEMVKASRRDIDRAGRWAARVSAKNADEARSKAKRENAYNRYAAVNTINSATIEFRLTRGTLNESTIRASLDYIFAIAKNAKRVLWSDAFEHPERMLKGIKESTKEYIASRDAFGDVLGSVECSKGGDC